MKPSRQLSDRRYDEFVAVVTQGLRELCGIMAVPVSDTAYDLFGRYLITRGSNGVTVGKLGQDGDIQFAVMRHAVTWSTIDYMGKYSEARRIRELDLQIQSDELEQQQHLRRRSSNLSLSDYIISANKLAELSLRIQRNRREMDKYITIAKQWQTRKLENATKRDEPRKSPRGTARPKRTV